MHAHMISYLVLHLWQDLYDESQDRVGDLERQLAALQVADDDDEEEEGAEEDAEVELREMMRMEMMLLRRMMALMMGVMTRSDSWPP